MIEKILPSRRGLGPRTAWEIVGVVADERARGLESPTSVGAYASFAQNPVVGLGLVVKGSGDGGALIKSAHQAVWKVNKDQVLDDPKTVEQIKADSMIQRRLTTSLLGGLALLAMLLVNAFSVPVTVSAWRPLPSGSSCAYSSENILALGFEWKTEYSGFCSAVFGPYGAMSWSSSNRKPLPPGIGLAFVCSGVFDRDQRALADR